MTKYVRQMSAGEIVRSAMELYRDNFWTLFLTYMIPITIVHLMLVPLLNETLWMVVDYLALLIVGMVSYAAISISISDVCTGNKPSLKWAYSYIFTVAPIAILVVCVLQVLAAFIGSLLLLIPGLIAGAWLMFAPIIVVLEKVGPVGALKRSKLLGEGFYFRNYGLLVIGIVIICIVLFALGAGIGILSATLQMGWATKPVASLSALIVGGFFYPYLYTMTILMYYDMRARKESYDSTSLTEDLLR